MTREAKIIDLYKVTYESDNIEEMSIEDMEEDLLHYYAGAGFDIKSIDDLLDKEIVLDDEFVESMEKKIEKAISEKE